LFQIDFGFIIYKVLNQWKKISKLCWKNYIYIDKLFLIFSYLKWIKLKFLLLKTI
jgi:hypothetical protein